MQDGVLVDSEKIALAVLARAASEEVLRSAWTRLSGFSGE
jgi:hypothetical protein